MELTKEHFDNQLENLHTSITQEINGKIGQQTTELKNYVHESFEAQQTYIEARSKETTNAIDVRKDLEKMKVEITKIKDVLKKSGNQNLNISWDN